MCETIHIRDFRWRLHLSGEGSDSETADPPPPPESDAESDPDHEETVILEEDFRERARKVPLPAA